MPCTGSRCRSPASPPSSGSAWASWNRPESMRWPLRERAAALLVALLTVLTAQRPDGRPNVAAAATFPAGVTPLAPLPPALTSVTPAFQWSAQGVPALAAPVTYRLRVGRDAGLANPRLDTTVVDVTSVLVRRPYKPGTPLYWRVDATSATGVAASTGVVGPIAVPSWATPLTLSAPGGTTTADPQPTLVWTSPPIVAPPGPFQYDVFLYRAGDPISVYGAGGLRDTFFQVPVALERNIPYSWRLVVRAGTDTSLVSSQGT